MDARRRIVHAEGNAIYRSERNRHGRHFADDQFHCHQPDVHSDADSYSNCHGYPNRITNNNSHGDAFCDPYGNTDSNSKPNLNAQRDTDTDCDSYCHPHSHTNTNSHPNRDSNRNAYRYAQTHSDSNSHADTDSSRSIR